jgi:hypothetical protein
MKTYWQRRRKELPYKTTTEFVTEQDIDAAMAIADRIDTILEDEENGIVAIAVTEILAGIVEHLHGEQRADAVREYLANACNAPEPLNPVN